MHSAIEAFSKYRNESDLVGWVGVLIVEFRGNGRENGLNGILKDDQN